MIRPAVLFALLLIAMPAMAADRFTEPRICDTPSETVPVCTAHRDWTEAEAAAMLGDKNVAAFAEDDTLTIVTRRADGPISLCCAIVAPLDRIGSGDLWALSLKVWKLNRAVLDIQLMPPRPQLDLSAFFGRDAASPVTVPLLAGSIVHETLQSKALNEVRVVHVYLPPAYDRTVRYPVVYLADGDVVAAYAPAIESLIITHRIRPLIVVGLGAGQGSERAREYRLGESAPRYAEHDSFVFGEVVPFIETKYAASPRREDRMLAGFSDGGAWALSAGVRHADRIGAVAALSFGWGPAAQLVDIPNRPRLFFAAGTLEPDFHRLTERTARRAQASGGDVVFEDYTAGHTLLAFRSTLLDSLVWAFPQK